MIGTTISHYKIIAKLGGGGMGVVYKAEDTKLKRTVALKFLPPELTLDAEAKERFIHEAQAASALQQANICTVHDIEETREGQLFIVMDCYEGETLKSRISNGQLRIEDAVKIAVEVSQGLARAHESGIVHRDIKPANIMLTKHDEVKIVDFGLAKLSGRTMLTKTGTTMGTAAYMSPEQALSQQADSRADIWSLGVVLYEMLAGRRPFESEYEQALVYSILNQAPEPMSKWRKEVPIELERIVSKCLEKDPTHRYQSAGELVTELKSISEEKSQASKGILGSILARSIWAKRKWTLRAIVAGAILVLVAAWYLFSRYLGIPSEPIPIAVISFENKTNDSTYEYLRDVIPSALISKLEQSSYVRVNTQERIGDLLKQIGKAGAFIDNELGFDLAKRDSAQALVRGTYMRAGNVFAIDVKVYDVATKKLLKTASSKGEGEGSIFSQIDELSLQISAGIGIPTSVGRAEEKSTREVTTSSVEAYRYFIRGRASYEKFLMDDAVASLKKAVELDSTFAMGYYYLARTLAENINPPGANRALEKAMRYAGKASRKEKLLIERYYASMIERNREKAYKIFLELEAQYPNDKWVLRDLGRFYRTSRPPLLRQAVSTLERALALDPKWTFALTELGYTYLDLNEYEKAAETFKKDIEANPADPNPFDNLTEAYFLLGKIDSAIHAQQEAKVVDPRWPSDVSLVYLYAVKEDYSSASKAIQRLQSDSAWSGAALVWGPFIYGWLGSRSQALGLLEKAREHQEKAYGSGNPGNNAGAYRMYGQAALNIDRTDIARKCFAESFRYSMIATPKDSLRHLADLKTSNAMADLRVGDVRSAQSNLAQARTSLSAAGGNSQMLTQAEAELLLTKGLLDSAITLWSKPPTFRYRFAGSQWVQLPTTNIVFRRDGLARAYTKRGDIDAAIKEYEQITTFDPANPDRRLIHPLHRYELAKLYEKKGMKEKAIAQYEKFLVLWKNADRDRLEPKDAKRRLAKLKG